MTYAHNVWTQGACGPTDRRVGSLGLVDPAHGDLRTGPGSPAIDAGDPASFPATDVTGAPRPRGRAPDAGAYEIR